jgi:hypothetical protein
MPEWVHKEIYDIDTKIRELKWTIYYDLDAGIIFNAKIGYSDINKLYIRIHDTYLQGQNEKDISILLDRDLSL